MKLCHRRKHKQVGAVYEKLSRFKVKERNPALRQIITNIQVFQSQVSTVSDPERLSTCSGFVPAFTNYPRIFGIWIFGSPYIICPDRIIRSYRTTILTDSAHPFSQVAYHTVVQSHSLEMDVHCKSFP